MEIFVNNEAQTPVYYDNLTVTMRGGVNDVIEVNAYYPFGMIMPGLSLIAPANKYNAYKHSAKEIQRELELKWYDHGSRMLDYTFSRWITPDPLAEMYYSTSPYSYVRNNPINKIDPNGMWEDDYRLKWNGGELEKQKTNDPFDRLIAENGKSIKVSKNAKGESVLSELATKRDEKDYNGNYAVTGNKQEAFKVFKFAADNSNVEWNLEGYRTKSGSNEYFIGTSHEIDNASSSYRMERFNELDMVFDLHSHPGYGNLEEGTRGASDYDKRYINGRYDRFKDAGMSNTNVWFNSGGGNSVFPKHYVYHVRSTTLYHYTPWVPNVYIRKVNSASGLYRNLGF